MRFLPRAERLGGVACPSMIPIEYPVGLRVTVVTVPLPGVLKKMYDYCGLRTVDISEHRNY